MNEIDLTQDYTVDKETWTNRLREGKQPFEFMPNAAYDFNGVDFLSPIIESYMTAPVSVYKGKHLEARTVVFDDIQATLDTFASNNERIVMYMLIWVPSMPIYSELDEETFTLKPLDTPRIKQGSWKMRFAKVE